jgi:VanZ family protein
MKSRWWVFFCLYVVLIAIGTLAIRGRSALEWVHLLVPPGGLQDTLVYLLHHHHPVTFSRLLQLTDRLVNIFLFIPVGLAVSFFLGSRIRGDIRLLLLCALSIGLLLSLGIELLQTYVPERIPSASDVVTNTSGAVLGCYFPYFRREYRKHMHHNENNLYKPGQKRA